MNRFMCNRGKRSMRTNLRCALIDYWYWLNPFNLLWRRSIFLLYNAFRIWTFQRNFTAESLSSKCFIRTSQTSPFFTGATRLRAGSPHSELPGAAVLPQRQRHDQEGEPRWVLFIKWSIIWQPWHLKYDFWLPQKVPRQLPQPLPPPHRQPQGPRIHPTHGGPWVLQHRSALSSGFSWNYRVTMLLSDWISILSFSYFAHLTCHFYLIFTCIITIQQIECV